MEAIAKKYTRGSRFAQQSADEHLSSYAGITPRSLIRQFAESSSSCVSTARQDTSWANGSPGLRWRWSFAIARQAEGCCLGSFRKCRNIGRRSGVEVGFEIAVRQLFRISAPERILVWTVVGNDGRGFRGLVDLQIQPAAIGASGIDARNAL
jgi:hypothetical protein